MNKKDLKYVKDRIDKVLGEWVADDIQKDCHDLADQYMKKIIMFGDDKEEEEMFINRMNLIRERYSEGQKVFGALWDMFEEEEAKLKK